MPAHKIVIDTDPGVDDVLAILLALASPEVDLALISIVFGNTHAPAAHANLLKIYHALAKEVAEAPEASGRYGRLGQKVKTVLALGEDGPIGGEKATAAYFVSGSPTDISSLSLCQWFGRPAAWPNSKRQGLKHNNMMCYGLQLIAARDGRTV